MKNKSRFLTVCTLVLCAALLAFGVYALKNATLTASGTIGFKAHDCNILVYGKITGAVTSADDLSGESKELYLVDYSGEGEFTKDAAFSVTGTKDLTFANNLWKYDEESTTAQKQPIIYFDDSGDTAPNIVLTLYLKNNSAYPVSVDAQITQTPDGITVSKSDLTRLEKDADYSELTITLTLDPDTDHIDTSDVNFGMSIYFAKTKEQLKSPQNVTVDADNKTVTFDAVDGATSYEIAYYKEGEDSDEPLYTQEVSQEEQAAGAVDLEYTPSESGNYVVKVRAVREQNGVKDYSNYQDGDNLFKYEKTTSASLFTFAGSAVTGYIGEPDVEEIIIPRSYDKDTDGNFIDGTKYKVDTIKAAVYTSGFTSFAGSVVLLDNITTIGWYTFYECSSLSGVTILGEITEIGFYAFGGCTSLTQITLPESLELISGCAFSGSGITKIIIPKQVTVIENNTFYNCKLLSSVEFKGEITKIGEAAFQDCICLSQITIPQSVTTIGENAFNSCSSLRSITLPNTISSVGIGAFSFCYLLKEVYYNGSLNEWCNIDFAISENSNPCWNSATLYIDNQPVTEIDFTGYTEIKPCIFCGCILLNTVTLPEDLNEIGAFAFWGTGITEITIPKNTTKIGDKTFWNCQKLSSVTFDGNKLEEIGGAFGFCPNLKHITLPNSLKILGEYAFYSSGLEEIIIPELVTKIEGSTFSRCKSLSRVSILGEVQEIKQAAFQDCGLTQITLPASVNSIGTDVFEYCNSLSKIYYIGNEEEFAALLGNVDNLDGGNQFFLDATVYYQIAGPEAIDGAPEKYWYYDPADETGNTIIDSDMVTP